MSVEALVARCKAVRLETIEGCAKRVDDIAQSFREEKAWSQGEGAAIAANRLRYGYDIPVTQFTRPTPEKP